MVDRPAVWGGCAGEDEQDIRPTMSMLADSGIYPIIDYAAEDDVQEVRRR